MIDNKYKTALKLCAKLCGEMFSVVLGAVMAESHDFDLPEAVIEDWMLNPLQQKVLRAIKTLKEEGLPVDQLMVFSRMEFEKELGYKLTMMGARINLFGRTPAYLLAAYEYAILGRMIKLLLPYRREKGVSDMLHLLSEAVHGRADKLAAFEDVAGYISNYCLAMPFGRAGDDCRTEHIIKIKKIKNTIANRKYGLQTVSE